MKTRPSNVKPVSSATIFPQFQETTMRRFMLIVAFFAFCAFTASAQDFSKVEMKVVKVADGIYMLQGAGGNIAISVGEDGVVMIDDEFAPLAPKIKAAIKSVTDKPIRFILNTHYH